MQKIIIKEYFNNKQKDFLKLEKVTTYKKLSRIGKLLYNLTKLYKKELIELNKTR